MGIIIFDLYKRAAIEGNKDFKGVEVNKSLVYRDLMFFIISNCLILIFAIDQVIYWYEALILLLVYVILVIVVYI